VNPLCECPVAGFCKRHQMQKTIRQHQLCRGTAETVDCGRKYWLAWERGQSGATAPAVPVVDPPSFCNGNPAVAKVTNSCCGGGKLADSAELPVINPHRQVPRPTDPPLTTPARWTEEPTRHLIYHLWPTRRSDLWRWNVEQLRKRIKLFNGLRIIGVAIDGQTVTIEAVKEAFAGVRIDHWVVVPNDSKLGEGATFHKMMAHLPCGPNDITFYGHGKGTKYEAGKAGVVPRWAELMYRSCLDHYSEVRKSLESHPITGSLKRYGDFNKPNTWRWHYSGTFFWFRNEDVFARPTWKRLVPFYGAIECWPSCVFRAEEAGSLIGHNAGLMYLEPEVAKHEAELATWPPDERQSTNGVSDRWFSDEERRRQIDSGNWPHLVATHAAGARALKSLGVRSVLEIGSGLGPFLIGAKTEGLDAAGMGCSPFERDFALTQGVPPERYELATVDKYQLSPVDAVYCVEVLEHIPDAELVPLLQELADNCRWFYFSSTPHRAADDSQWGHINLKSRQEWIDLFQRHGLKFVKDEASVVPWGILFRGRLQDPPSLLQRGIHFARAMGRWIASGAQLRSQERVNELLKICQACPLLQDGMCVKCGCNTNGDVSPLNKLAVATEACPIGRWSD
jgi:2-polyprenyl-3-methyl-5-hydroxy-6-metoxy-1,4-benzoquinol methylase